jgi:hypothetical protein
MVCCHGEAARSFLAKVLGSVFASFHALLQNFAVEPRIHSYTCWNRCFTLPQLLYIWWHQSGIFWIPPRSKAVLILNLSTRWKWVVSFVCRLVYHLEQHS